MPEACARAIAQDSLGETQHDRTHRLPKRPNASKRKHTRKHTHTQMQRCAGANAGKRMLNTCVAGIARPGFGP
eukprot:9209503-Alexandrium_andersonii.AAC.1